ncbi:uncharacterized protein LOC113385789 [Ctenocephalides felis]|uniref:uncharacterized protein LOC113385789 n=1 Tax=Ctenocephalides felis TaxID=7515 RepID=UPI000E6E3904|nr:uncharacterized protein LOC113385789 [Ctenocephalides felis]
MGEDAAKPAAPDMRGWFDAFRSDGGPTLYGFNNRTPVTGDVHTVAACVLFGTLYLAFLLVFPGVRKQWLLGAGWHVACTEVTASYRAFSNEKISARIGAHVGLGYVNVTMTVQDIRLSELGIKPGYSGSNPIALITNEEELWRSVEYQFPHNINEIQKRAKNLFEASMYTATDYLIKVQTIPVGNWSPPSDIDYNERFRWGGAGEMEDSYEAALRRGLPYPVLTVAEYFSLGQEGFAWGGQYRAAGYYASILLGTALACWLLMNLLLVAVPRYGAYLMFTTGLLLAATDLGYYLMLPARPLRIVLEGGALDFRLGWCFWLVLVAGSICSFSGLVITCVDLAFPHRFSTVLEVYYDTPYDRHVILEESHDTRYRKRNSGGNGGLEDPPGFGSRILRRLSSKTREHGAATDRYGIDNHAFQPTEPPKSPWRYPFRRTQIASAAGNRQRTGSQDSASSATSSTATPAGNIGQPGVHRAPINRLVQ